MGVYYKHWAVRTVRVNVKCAFLENMKVYPEDPAALIQ